jgi:hypothetical protein
MPNASSAKIPAVEMPGDSLGRLDVSFGALDLQFGGSASANSESMSGGFEFGTSEDKTSTSSKPVSTGDVTSFAPSAKEVNKSLSNALTGTGGKLNAVSAPAQTATPTQQQADSFSKAASAVVSVSSSVTANQPQAPTGSSGFGNKPQDLTSYNYNNYKGYNNYQQYQYPNSNNYSSSAQQQTGSGSQYKSGPGQYDKYDSSAQLQNNPAAAVLGLASTSTTNALSGKVSATTASKVNMPNLPPGVASMLHHPQYMATGLAPAFYGLQQPMYGAYGNAGFDDLAAIQRATASAAGLHTLPTTGFYDPNNQFAAATSLGAAVAANNRDGSTNLNSLTGVSTTSSTGSAIGSSSASSGFGSASSTTANDSNSSPGPNAIITTTASGSGSQQHHVQQQPQQQHPQQQQQQQQQTAFNLAATNALAAQQMPPGYAYFYGNMGTLPAAYGAATATPSHVYQPTAMTVPGATAGATSQFQKTYGTNNAYGSQYDTLGQQGTKDFTNSYSSNGQSKSSGGSAGAGSGKGHQYWGNTLTSAPLW